MENTRGKSISGKVIYNDKNQNFPYTNATEKKNLRLVFAKYSSMEKFLSMLSREKTYSYASKRSPESTLCLNNNCLAFFWISECICLFTATYIQIR